jgi:hypothetical protein
MKFAKQKRQDTVHSMHNMYMQLRGQDEAKADIWLNQLPKGQKNMLTGYWMKNGFSYLISNIGIGG